MRNIDGTQTAEYKCDMSKKPKRKPGRPVTTGTNKVREIGRWSDDEWEVIKKAAVVAKAENTTAWAKKVLRKSAARILRDKRRKERESNE